MNDSCYLRKPCELSRSSNAAEITGISESCQVVFAGRVKKPQPSSFGLRLKQAFEGANNTEIAQKLNVSNSTITDYVKGTSYPTADGLLKIAGITKCNLHWLLTGQGEADLDPLRFLDDRTRGVVQRLASGAKVPAEQLLADLTTEALTRRASELIENYRQLDGAQIDQLQAILTLIDFSEGEEAAGKTRRRSSG